MKFKRSLVMLAAAALCVSSFAANYVRVPTGTTRGAAPVSSHPATSGLSGSNPTSPPAQANVSTTPGNGGALSFGSLTVNTVGSPVTAVVANSGNAASPLSWSVTGPFQVYGTDCGATLAAGSQCGIGVAFAPTAEGPGNGTLSITHAGGSSSISLSGVGAPAPRANLVSSSIITWGTFSIGETSNQVRAHVVNNGNAGTPLSWSVDGPFVLSRSECGPSIAAGGECDLYVAFKPNAVGPATGKLTLTYEGGTFVTSLSGTGAPAPTSSITFSPATDTNFGTSAPTGELYTATYTLRNTGKATATGVSVEAIGAETMVMSANTCGTPAAKVSLGADATCAVTVKWEPATAGSYMTTLVFTGSADSGLPRNIEVKGTAVLSGTIVTVSPAVGGKTTFNLDKEKIVFASAGVYEVTALKPFNGQFKAWGGGGINGAAGGYVAGAMAVSSNTKFTVRVDAAGGTGGVNNANQVRAGNGGGLAGLFSGSTVSTGSALLVAGGGSGGSGAGVGGAAGGTTGADGVNVGGSTCKGTQMQGRGGTLSAGGAAGTPYDTNTTLPTAGSALAGGSGGSVTNASWGAGAGGGGGYYGGGGGSGGGSCKGGAGGGSSFVSGTLANGVNTAGSGTTPGNASDGDRGDSGSQSVMGRVVISKF